MKPSMNFGGGAPVLPDWKQQRNGWQDQMQAGNMGDPAFRQQMFDARNAWQQARNGWANQQPVMSRETLPVNPMQNARVTPQPGFGNEAAMNQNWFQQNHPALQQWFQQQLGMKPTGLFPFAPDRRLLG